MDIKIVDKDIKFKCRVSGIFLDNGKVLVNKYGDDTYCLPGGYVNIGETSEDAVLRELKEEIGIDFKIDSYAGIMENFFVNLRNQKTHGIDFYYYVTLKYKKNIKSINYNRVENDNGFIIKHNFSWIDISELDKYNLLPYDIKEQIKNKNTNFHMIKKD